MRSSSSATSLYDWFLSWWLVVFSTRGRNRISGTSNLIWCGSEQKTAAKESQARPASFSFRLSSGLQVFLVSPGHQPSYTWAIQHTSVAKGNTRSHSDRPLQSGSRYPVSIRPGSVCRCTSSQKLPSDKRLLPRRVLSHRPNSVPGCSPAVSEQPLGLPSAALANCLINA
jgi:hypothetical protein